MWQIAEGRKKAVKALRFSIVIPVYNVEQYLHECIESVLAQSNRDFEVILVDDGATDHSGEICDSYAQKHPEIQVIHQKNGGLSAARNTGMRAAKGEYILFLDSDDWLESFALDIFETKMEQVHADIYAGNAMRVENGEKHLNFPKRRDMDVVVSGREFMENAFSQNAFSAPAPFNVYRRELLLENQMFFKEGILHEDEWWTPQVFLKAETAVNVDPPFYMYRIRSGSIMTSEKPRVKNGIDATNICLELECVVRKYPREQVKWLRNHMAEVYMSAVYMGNLPNVKEVRINRVFSVRNALTVKNKIKALLFMASPALYCWLDKKTKVE